MRLLLANDDGICARGLAVLGERLSREHDVYVIAPVREMSGASHSAHFGADVRYEKRNIEYAKESYAVDGTPADCVLFGLNYALKDKGIDAVVSGINNVLNSGTDILYSGTFGAAQEATFLGYKGIAVSLDAKEGDDFSFTADFVAKNLNKLLKYADSRHTVNVNVPHDSADKIRGVRATPTGHRPFEENIITGKDEDGNDVYRVYGHPLPKPDVDDDAALIERGYITVTPVPLFSNDGALTKKMSEEEFLL